MKIGRWVPEGNAGEGRHRGKAAEMGGGVQGVFDVLRNRIGRLMLSKTKSFGVKIIDKSENIGEFDGAKEYENLYLMWA